MVTIGAGLFTRSAPRAYPSRTGRSVAMALLLHGVVLAPWLVSTLRVEPAQSLAPRGVSLVLAPVRGLGAPLPGESTAPSRERPRRSPEPEVATPPAPAVPHEAAPLAPVLLPGLEARLVELSPGVPTGAGERSRGQSDDVADGTTESTTPPAIGAAGGQSNWAGLVLARLQQFKRYPAEAQRRREEGVCHVRFAIDRDGRVQAAALIETSGRTLLDREAVALVRRASPLPPPPPEVEGDLITLTVPVEFFLAR